MVFRDRSTSRDPLRSILYKLWSVKDKLRNVLSLVFFGRLIFKKWQIWRCREIVISVASLVFPTICCPEQCSNRRRIQDSVFLLIPIFSLNFPNILLCRFSLACCNLAKFHLLCQLSPACNQDSPFSAPVRLSPIKAIDNLTSFNKYHTLDFHD